MSNGRISDSEKWVSSKRRLSDEVVDMLDKMCRIAVDGSFKAICLSFSIGMSSVLILVALPNTSDPSGMQISRYSSKGARRKIDRMSRLSGASIPQD